MIRQRLADCLEALGRRDEADSERARADECLIGSNDTFAARLAQGKLYERENRHAEAFAAYERGLALVPAHRTEIQIEFMTHLVLSSFNAGRSPDTVHWAETVLTMNPGPVFADACRRMAAVSLGNLGRLDEAERYAREAAEHARDDKSRASALALVASYACRRGQLDEAERGARHAESLSPGAGNTPWAVLSEVARLRGNFTESIDYLHRTKAQSTLFIPASQRRMDAAISHTEARILAELGRVDEALALLRSADAEVGNDPKLGPSIDATTAHVLALRGEDAAARDRIASAVQRRQDIPQARSSQQSILADLGRAALVLGDPALAEQFWKGYHDTKPDPVYQPTALYHLAECRRLLDDHEAAVSLYRQTTSTHFGLHYERLARQRLAELQLANESRPS